MRPVYTITAQDVGKNYVRPEPCECCGQDFPIIWTVNFMGCIQEQDVGKRIYARNGIYSVENDQQLHQRRMWAKW